MNYQVEGEAKEWGERKECSLTYIGQKSAQTNLEALGGSSGHI